MAGLIVLLIRFVVRVTQKSVVEAATALVGFVVMASPPIWAGPATTAIDHVRFFYNEHFYHQAVREQAFGKDRGFVAFDWGSSGSAIGPTRIHNLVHSENADFRMPMIPDNCQSTVIHLSGKFYSRRMLCG